MYFSILLHSTNDEALIYWSKECKKLSCCLKNAGLMAEKEVSAAMPSLLALIICCGFPLFVLAFGSSGLVSFILNDKMIFVISIAALAVIILLLALYLKRREPNAKGASSSGGSLNESDVCDSKDDV
jgi:hypothetical protein